MRPRSGAVVVRKRRISLSFITRAVRLMGDVLMVGFAQSRAGTVVVAVVAVSVAAVQADTIYVDANCPGGDGSELDPYCSIQTAIDNAVNMDEILVAPGTYFETINFLGKAITLRSSDGAEVTTIDAQQMGSVVTCETREGPEALLEGFTITGGTGTNIDSVIRGGGMLNIESSPTVTGCTFIENAADLGGGVYNTSSDLVLTACTFVGNAALQFGVIPSGQGGAIYNIAGDSTVANCTLLDNTANFEGGGMFSYSGALTVTNCILWDNSPDQLLGITSVSYSNVQNGFAGSGNINVDPQFVDLDNGDLRLMPGSPCIDAGNNWGVSPDFVDLDSDDDTIELTPLDLDGEVGMSDRLLAWASIMVEFSPVR